MLKTTWYDRMIEWRERHISEKHLVLLLSFFVGAFSAAAAALLKSFIHLIQWFVENHLIANEHTWWYLITPLIGITLAALFVRYIVRDDISHGITKILYAISQRKSIIKAHNMWSSVVGSGLTIGFGGSVGAEAPIVLTGAAIGSNLAKAFRLDQKTMMLMIGCGAAGAIGGIFKAPIAGLVFTLEVLMMDLTMTSVAPLLISSVTATAISYILTGVQPMFPLNVTEPFLVHRIPWYLILGAICGLASLYFTRGMNRLEQWMKHTIGNMWLKLLVGGIMLSVLIFLFPPLYGEGYDVIRQLINGDSLANNKDSFYAVYDASSKKYVFSGLRNYILDIINNKGGVASPEDVNFVIMPIDVTTYTNNASSSYYYYYSSSSTTSVVTKIAPAVSKPSMVKLNLEKAIINLMYSKQMLY